MNGAAHEHKIVVAGDAYCNCPDGANELWLDRGLVAAAMTMLVNGRVVRLLFSDAGEPVGVEEAK